MRRQFLHLALGAAALPDFPRFALALDYPTRPRVIVALNGGVTDTFARLMAQAKEIRQAVLCR